MKKTILLISILFSLFIVPFANAEVSSSEKFKDECIQIIHNGLIRDKINLFFLSEGYSNPMGAYEFQEHVTSYVSDDAFFSITPYKENKEIFNVYAVWLPSQNFDCTKPITGEPQENNCIRENIIPAIGNLCFGMDESPTLNNDKKTIIIALNKNFQGNPHVTGNGMFALPGTPVKIGSFLHELGHIWGDFGEEYTDVYIPQPRSFYPFNLDEEGCPKWCSGNLNTSANSYRYYLNFLNCTANIPNPPETHREEWKQCYEEAGSANQVWQYDLGINCIEDTGCYGFGESINDWHAYQWTIMAGGGMFDLDYGYGKINEEYLKEVLIGLSAAPEEQPIPDSIVNKSNQFIISKVGQEFFNNYITLNSELSKYYPPEESCIKNPSYCADYLQKPYYFMVYSFKIPEKPYVDELLELAVDTEGNIIAEREATGTPNCVSNPNECLFSIDEAEAIQIAKNAGLEGEMADWETSFYWIGGDIKTYAWSIQNTTTPTSGEVVLINANSGEIIGISPWQAMESSASGIQLTLTQGEIDIFPYISIIIIAILVLSIVIWKVTKK